MDIKDKCSEQPIKEGTYADDLRDAFNAGLNHAAEIVLKKCKSNVVQKELAEAIRMEMK